MRHLSSFFILSSVLPCDHRRPGRGRGMLCEILCLCCYKKTTRACDHSPERRPGSLTSLSSPWSWSSSSSSLSLSSSGLPSHTDQESLCLDCAHIRWVIVKSGRLRDCESLQHPLSHITPSLSGPLGVGRTLCYPSLTLTISMSHERVIMKTNSEAAVSLLNESGKWDWIRFGVRLCYLMLGAVSVT